MKRAAVASGLVVFLVLVATGVGYAYWVATGSVSTTVKVGTFEATLDGVDQLDAVHTDTSAPDIATLTLGVAGSGAVTMELSTTGDNEGLMDAIRLRTWRADAGGCGTAVPEQGVRGSTLAAPLLPADAASLAAPAAVVLCAATDVPNGYADYAGQRLAATLMLTASLTGSTWEAFATGEFEQQLEAAASQVTCDPGVDHSNVIISWQNPPNAPTSAKYLVNVISQAGAVVQSPGVAGYWSPSLTLSAYLFSAGGDFTIQVLMFPADPPVGTGTLVGTTTAHTVTSGVACH
jgi:hypothetical protein